MSTAGAAGARLVEPEWTDGAVRPPVRLLMCADYGRHSESSRAGQAAARQWATNHADTYNHVRFLESTHRILTARYVQAVPGQRSTP